MVRAQARACAVSVTAGNRRRSSTAADNSPRARTRYGSRRPLLRSRPSCWQDGCAHRGRQAPAVTGRAAGQNAGLAVAEVSRRAPGAAGADGNTSFMPRSRFLIWRPVGRARCSCWQTRLSVANCCVEISVVQVCPSEIGLLKVHTFKLNRNEGSTPLRFAPSKCASDLPVRDRVGS